MYIFPFVVLPFRPYMKKLVINPGVLRIKWDGEKTASSTNVVGKSGYLPTENWN
jgi:hypothetical protein